MTGSCFERQDQGRVDVDTSIPYSRRPTVGNNMAGGASLITIPECVGPLATDSNTICKAIDQSIPNHCRCAWESPNWFRYGPIRQQSTGGSFTATIYGWGCESGIKATKMFSTTTCSNTYPAYDVLVPCSGAFPCPRGTANAPSVLENSQAGTLIAHFDYADCDTCTLSHGQRPSCTLSNGQNTLTDLSVFPTVDWPLSATETAPVYELADDAGGRFVIDTDTNQIKTGTTPLDYELGANPSGIGSWTCTTVTNQHICFSGAGITNQVTSKSQPVGSTWDPSTKEWTVYVYVTDVVGCRNTGGETMTSGPFPIKIKVDNVVEVPSTINFVPSLTNPMDSSGHLKELYPASSQLGNERNPGPWSLDTNKKVGTLSYSSDGDCSDPGITCTFECQTLSGWVSGNLNSCGGPVKNTFKIVDQSLLLATSSTDALDYEGGSSGAILDVTVRVVATMIQNGFPTTIMSGGIIIQVTVANVDEVPTDIIFVSSGPIQENAVEGTEVGTLFVTDPDCPITNCLTIQSTMFFLVGGPPELTVLFPNKIVTTSSATNFEPPGPAYTFTVQALQINPGSPPLPVPNVGNLLQKEFTIVVTDVIEAPSAADGSFALDENAASGTFVGNYGSPAYVTLGDGELTFDIIKENSARKEYAYTALSVNTGTGKATMTLNTASGTGEVIQAGDKLSVWGDETKRTLVSFSDGNKLSVDDNLIKLKVDSTIEEWIEGSIVFLDLTGCTDDATRMKLNGPKQILYTVDSTIFSINSFGLEEGIHCNGGVVYLMKDSSGNAAPNGIFTVTSASSTTIEYQTGIDSKHIGTWSTGTAYVMGFEMEECSGILTVASNAINYEYKATFLLEVQVRTEQTINTATVTVTVGNVDEAPYFKALPSNANADECDGLTCIGSSHNVVLDGNGNTYMIDDPEGQSDFTLEVVDDAGNRNGAGIRTWFIDNTAPRTLMRISSAVLDYETKSTYSLQILAKDNDDPIHLRVQVALTVTLNNINEAPVFSPLFFSVSEAAAPLSSVSSNGVLPVFDPEGDDTTLQIMWTETVAATNLHVGNVGTMLDSDDRPFTWQSGTAEGASSTKVLLIGANSLDYETIQQYTLVMKACDLHVTGSRCESIYTSVEILVLGVNEAPAWNQSSYMFYVDENTADGSIMTAATGGNLVGSLATYVNDQDADSTFTFSIEPDLDGSGAGVGGWLTSPIQLMTELGNPLRINILAATSSGTAPNFELGPRLVVNGAIPAAGDRTTGYKFNLKVVDNGGLPAGGSTAAVEIRILDSNEPPSFSTSTREINENSNVGDKVYTEGDTTETQYMIMDDDVTLGLSGQTVSLSIVSGNIGNAFELTKLTGVTDYFEIQVQTAVLNYEGEAGTSYYLNINIVDVEVTGNLAGAESTATIEIKIINVNDSPTISAQSVSILESAKEGDCVTPATFSAEDEDLPAQTLTYVLTGPPETGPYSSSVFDASSVTGGRQGKICIASGGLGGGSNTLESSIYTQTGGSSSSSIGGCETCVYSFTLTVTDTHPTNPLSASAALTLSIGSDNKAPSFTAGVCALSRSLPENTLPGTIFGAQIVATDPDDDDQLTLTLINTADNKFAVVLPTVRSGSSSGSWSFGTQLKPTVSLDFEAGTNTYLVRVRAADNVPVPSTVECDVQITLTNVNEAPDGSVAVFGASLSVAENSLPHVFVGSIISTDPDGWQDLNWGLPIAGNPNPNPFYVLPRTESLFSIIPADPSLWSSGTFDSGSNVIANAIPTYLSAVTDGDWATWVQLSGVTLSSSDTTFSAVVSDAVRAETIRIVVSGDDGIAFTIKMPQCDFNLVPPVASTESPSHWKLSTAPKEFVLTGCTVTASVAPEIQFDVIITSTATAIKIHELSIMTKARAANVLVSGFAPINYEALALSGRKITLLVEVTDVGGTDGEGLTASGTVFVTVTDQAEPPFEGSDAIIAVAENTASDAASLYQIGAVQPGDPDATGTSGHSYSLFRPGGMSTTSSCWKMTAYPLVLTPIPVLFGVGSSTPVSTPPICSFLAVIGISSIQDFVMQLKTNRVGVAPADQEIFRWQINNAGMDIRLGIANSAWAWTGTQAEAVNDFTSVGLLMSASCPWRNTACGDKSTWIQLASTSLDYKYCSEVCRNHADCLYFQYGESRSSGPNCWIVPKSYGESCLEGLSGSRENKFAPSDLHFCKVAPKKDASIWVSIKADSYSESGGCADVAVKAGAGNTIGTNIMINEQISNNMGAGYFDQSYRGEVSSSAGELATLGPMCFSSAMDMQPHVLFDVDSGDGSIVLRPTSGGANSLDLDFEAKQVYGILVEVIDTAALNPTPSLSYRRITVTDVNEPPVWSQLCPTDSSLVACLVIPEETTIGTSVTQIYGGSLAEKSEIQAIDSDASDLLTYTIVGGNILVGSTSTAAFSIESGTSVGSGIAVELKVAATGLDTEASANPWYDLMVRVADTAGLTPPNSGIVRVYLSDINEPPSMPAETFNVAEDATPALTSWNLQGSDSDPTPSFSTLSYSILVMPENDLALGGNAVASTTATGTDANNVLIDDNSKTWKPAAVGETQATLDIDFRKGGLTTNKLCLQLASSSEDGIPNKIEIKTKSTWEDVWSSQLIYPDGDTCGESPAALLCYLLEEPVQFLRYEFTGSCATARTTIHPDMAVRRVEVYGVDLFSLFSTSGVLSLTEGALNFETYSEYTIGVRVTDGGGLFADNNVVIKVTDINELPSVGIQRTTCVQGCTDANRNVPEGSPETFEIGLPIPSDDLDNVLRDVQALTYSMEVLDGPQVFSIHGCTGQLEVLLPSLLDYETKTFYKIRVRIVDDGDPMEDANGIPMPSGSASTLVIVSITDVNESPVLENQRRNMIEVELNLGGTRHSGSDVGDSVGAPLFGSDPDNVDSNIWTMIISSTDITAITNVGITQNGYMTWTVTILSEELTTTAADTSVTQTGTNGIGTLAVALDGNSATTTFTIRSAIGQNFNTATELVIGGGSGFTIAQAKLVSVTSATVADATGMLRTALTGEGTTSVVIDAETNVVFHTTEDLVVNSIAIPSASLTTATHTGSIHNKQTLTYSIVGGIGSKYFTMNGATGQVTVAQLPTIAESSELNFEANNIYALTIQLEDDGVVAGGTTSTLFTTATFTIDVLDIPETPIAPDYTLPTTIVENVPIGTQVGLYNVAYDPDNLRTLSTDPLTYVYHGINVDHSFFGIDLNTGIITTLQALDFETKTSHTLNVRVTDSTGLYDDAVVTITVEDVKEGPTVTDPQNAYFVENSAVGTAAATTVAGSTGFRLSVSDEDDTTWTYTLVSTIPITDMFGMETNGAINLVAARLNYESVTQFSVNIRATDAAGNSDEGLVTVHVSNTNDAPYYTVSGASYTYTLSENSPKDTLVNVAGTICVQDEDINTDGTAANSHSFAVKTQSPAGMFDIVGNSPIYSGCTASVRVKVFTTQPLADLNFEAPGGGRYDITVTVTDDGSPVLSADAGIVINLINENDTPILNDATLMIGETANVGATIDTIIASDEDLGQPTEILTYTILSGNICGTSSIEIFVGTSSNNRMVLTVANWRDGLTTSPTDDIKNCPVPSGGAVMAAGDTFSLSILVTDAFMNVQATDIGTISIELTEANDPPDYSSVCTGNPLAAARSIPEDASLNQAVSGGGPLVATDGDGPAPLTYGIISGNVGNQFSISNTGVLVVSGESGTLDYENAVLRTYTLELRASDGLGASTACTVTISVTDVNEAPSISDKTRSIAEDAAVGNFVGDVVSGTDPEGDTLIYQLAGSSSFDIDSSTAQIRVQGTLDYELIPSYTVTITIFDGPGAWGGPVEHTAWPGASLEQFATESDARAACEDALRTPNCKGISLKFSTGGTGGGTSGTYYTWAAAGYDSPLQSYTNWRSWEYTPGLSDTCVITILIIDVNDSPVLADLSFAIPESLVAGSQVPAGTTLGGTDEDITDDTDAAPLRYTMVVAPGSNAGEDDLGAAQSIFEVTPDQDSPGRPRLSSLSLKVGVQLNHETAAYYVFGLQVSDDEGASSISTVRIDVVNENEAPEWSCVAESENCPFSSSSKYSIELPENTPPGTMLRDLPSKVSDPDGVWTHVISAGCSDVISEGMYNQDDRNSAAVPTCWKGYDDESIRTMMLNGEMKIVFNEGESNALTMYVQLVDYPSGALRTFATNPSNNGAKWRMSEDAKWHGPCSHSSQLTQGTWFSMKVPSRATYSCAASNYENTFYSASGWTNRDSATMWPFNGFPDDDQNDAFKNAKIYARTNWGTSQYSIVASSPASGVFTISRESWPKNDEEYETSRLSVALSSSPSSLDYESGSDPLMYALTVRATDGGDASSDTTFRVVITNINEAPLFPSSADSRILTIDENSNANLQLDGSLVATDPDDPSTHNGALHYDIVGGSGAEKFRLSVTSDSVSSARKRYLDASPLVFTTSLASLDFEKLASYTLSVRAYDGMRTCMTITSADETIAGTANQHVVQSQPVHSGDDGICVYWEVQVDTSTGASGSAPWIGVTAHESTSVSSWNSDAFYVRQDPDDSVKNRNIKRWGTTDVDESIENLAQKSPSDPSEGRLCTHWQELSSEESSLPSEVIHTSLNNVYRLRSSSDDQLFIYDPNPRWGNGETWQSNTVRSDGTSDVRCAAGATGTWSASLPSSSDLLPSSCLIKEGIIGSSNCEEGSTELNTFARWILFHNGQTVQFGAGMSHPCSFPGVTFVKLDYCSATVDATITTLPVKTYGMVIDYDPDLIHDGPVYPPVSVLFIYLWLFMVDFSVSDVFLLFIFFHVRTFILFCMMMYVLSLSAFIMTTGCGSNHFLVPLQATLTTIQP